MADKIINVTNQRPFVMVYNDFLKSDLLTAQEKVIFIYLKMHAGKNENAFPSMNTLARETGYSRRSVIRYIESMESKGVIRVKRRDSEEQGRQSNLYQIMDVPSIWNIKADESGRIDKDKLEELTMIERLQAKGYIVTKKEELTSVTDQSTDGSPKELQLQNSYSKNTKNQKKNQPQDVGQSKQKRSKFATENERTYDYDELEKALLKAQKDE